VADDHENLKKHLKPSLSTLPVHQQKAQGAALDEQISRPMAALGSLLSPEPYIRSAIKVMYKVEVTGGHIKDFDRCVGMFLDLGNSLVEYGELRDYDISDVKEFLKNREITG